MYHPPAIGRAADRPTRTTGAAAAPRSPTLSALMSHTAWQYADAGLANDEPERQLLRDLPRPGRYQWRTLDTLLVIGARSADPALAYLLPELLHGHVAARRPLSAGRASVGRWRELMHLETERQHATDQRQLYCAGELSPATLDALVDALNEELATKRELRDLSCVLRRLGVAA